MALPATIVLDARLLTRQSTGDSTYWVGLLHGLREAQPRARFVLASDQPAPPGFVETDSISWRREPAPNSRWWSLITLPRLARALKADLVHVQYSASPLLRTPFVTTIHDVSFFVGPQWFKPKDRLLLRSSVPKAAKRAKVVLTVSEASKWDIVKHLSVPEDNVVATYLAPHPDLLAPLADQVASRLGSLGVARPYALSVSTRWPRKNMDLAVRAMERLAATTPHRLVLTGKAGWGEAAQGRRTQAVGYVDMDDLAALYGGADLYLCPSLYEGFGLPVVEAFAMGCPVVVGPGGSLPEVAGDAGLVLPDYEVETWRAAIESLVADPDRRAAMAEAGRQRANEFSWTKMAQGVWTAYERAMSG